MRTQNDTSLIVKLSKQLDALLELLLLPGLLLAKQLVLLSVELLILLGKRLDLLLLQGLLVTKQLVLLSAELLILLGKGLDLLLLFRNDSQQLGIHVW